MQNRRQGSESQNRGNIDSDQNIPKKSQWKKIGRNNKDSKVGMGLDDIGRDA
jgi:hypothetical protein